MVALSSQSLDDFPSREDFASQIGTIFLVGTEPGTGVESVLMSLDENIVSDTQENYTLSFSAPAESGLSQGLYHLENEALGSFQLFLVPTKRDQQGLYLEAVINRLIKG